jgi:hypothetical protein
MVVTVLALSLLGGVSLTACGVDGPTDGYTGTAVVKEHHRSGKTCRGTVERKDGVKVDNFYFGRKSVCSSITDNSTINIENGQFKR